MTTNVFDGRAGMMASDSRWSLELKDPLGKPHALVVVDDTGFDKVIHDEEIVAIFAGPSLLIDSWKRWFRRTDRSWKNNPGVADDFAVCWADIATHELEFEHGQVIAGDNFRFAGTGAKPAYDCWQVNQDARRCVDTAKSVDFKSGGEVVTFCLNSRVFSGSDGTHDLINAAILTRGVVMYSDQKKVPFAQAAENDPLVKDIQGKLTRGDVSMNAPAGKDPVVWTDFDKQRLDVALKKRFPEK